MVEGVDHRAFNEILEGLICRGGLAAAYDRQPAGEGFLHDERQAFTDRRQEQGIARLVERHQGRPLQAREHVHVRQAPGVGIDAPPPRQSEDLIWPLAGQPLDDVQALLFDEAADEQHHLAFSRQAETGASTGAIELRGWPPEEFGVDAVEDDLRRRLETDRREMLLDGLTDEHDLVGRTQHGPRNHGVGHRHESAQHRALVGHRGDVLDEHDGLAMPTRCQHRHHVCWIQRVMQKKGVGCSHRTPDGSHTTWARQRQWESESSFRDVPGADRHGLTAAVFCSRCGRRIGGQPRHGVGVVAKGACQPASNDLDAAAMAFEIGSAD